MNTMFAVTVFVVILFVVGVIIVRIWGNYEIEDSDYYIVADILRRYHSLEKFLVSFKHTGVISRNEFRAITKESRRLDCRHNTRMTVAARKKLIRMALRSDV